MCWFQSIQIYHFLLSVNLKSKGVVVALQSQPYTGHSKVAAGGLVPRRDVQSRVCNARDFCIRRPCAWCDREVALLATVA